MKRLLLLLLALPLLTMAQVPNSIPNTYVNDIAKVLNAGQVELLNKQLRALETKYSIQLAIVLLNDLPADYDIEKYTLELGRKWHVGNADNGMVYVAAINQHKQRLEVANRVQGNISDVDASNILDGIKPYFRKKDYAAGLSEMITDIDNRLNPAQSEQRALVPINTGDNRASAWWLLLIPGIGLIGFVLYRIFRKTSEPEVYNEPLYTKTATSYYPVSNNNVLIVETPSRSYEDYTPPSRSYDSDSPYSSSSSSSSSSDYGSWGSDSSSSSSSDSSGFSGGGSSSDW